MRGPWQYYGSLYFQTPCCERDGRLDRFGPPSRSVTFKDCEDVFVCNRCAAQILCCDLFGEEIGE